MDTRHEISEKQMLPLFRVISDLENTYKSTALIEYEDHGLSCGDEAVDSSIIFIGDIDYSAYRKERGMKRDSIKIKKFSTVDASIGKKHTTKLQRTDMESSTNKSRRKTFSANFISPKSTLYSRPKKTVTSAASKSADHLRREDNLDDVVTPLWSEEPFYEDPRDLLDTKPATMIMAKKQKPKLVRRKASSVASEDGSRDLLEQDGSRTKIDRLKKRLSAKYEDLISKLIDKCEENELKFSEKQDQIEKLSEKLKLLHQYNNQFGDENDRLRQHQEELKAVASAYKEQLETLQTQLENKVEKEVATENECCVDLRDSCTKCLSSNESVVLLTGINRKLHQDLLMLKNVVYRLNVQLSRYQEKLRDSQTSLNQDEPLRSQMKTIFKKNPNFTIASSSFCGLEPTEREMPSIPSLPLLSEDTSYMAAGESDDDEKQSPDPANLVSTGLNKSASAPTNAPSNEAEKLNAGAEDSKSASSKEKYLKRDLAWGDVNSHTLAPLLNAYQDSAAEREQLIHDYEKSFNRFTLKLKEVVNENDCTHDKLEAMTGRAIEAETKATAVTHERDRLAQERDRLKERYENMETKAKEIQEVYEQKVAVMARDYEILHREYFEMKTKLAALDVQVEQVSQKEKAKEDEYERKVAECTRLFEDLKAKYADEKESSERRIADVERDKMAAFEKMAAGMADIERLNVDVRKLRKDLRLSKRLVNMLRLRLSAAKTSLDSYRRKWKRTRSAIRNMGSPEAKNVPTTRELQLASTLEKIREEMKVVQRSAYKQLEAVDRRIRDQERCIASLQARHASEIQKANILVEQKELMIENLLDKLSGYENVPDSKVTPQEVLGNSPKCPQRSAEQMFPSSEFRGSYFLHKDRERIMSRRNF